MAKHIGIISGNGGVGKTTIALNLAMAMHQLGEHTLLVDGNLHNPHLRHHLKMPTEWRSVHDYLLGHASHAETITKHESGLSLVCGNHQPSEKLNEKGLADYREHASTIIYDCPPGRHHALLNVVDQVALVVQPDDTGVLDAYKTLDEARKEQKIIIGAIVNDHRGTGKLRDETISQRLGIPVVARIGHDKRFEKAKEARTPYVQSYPKRAASKTLTELASRISVRPRP